ncbi:uncharacterized protein LOC108212304 [Daucus carota subsp. sativus]|uniref:uncharacterized protein LOC108212304 n=1 Tax=Daucus carota subsp. sativus TaxID=79200 RepID=UPI0007EFC766|nr:PREDICTED: replication protein A 70 kDa DNA-binding subunit-like [Daucus carota subsp. sativus]
MHKFEFIDLGDLFSVASSYRNAEFPYYSADVIGVLEDYQPLKTIDTKYGDTQILKFNIADGRHSHQVTVWGALAVSTHAQYVRIVERPIIAILLNTIPSLKIYFNLDNEAVSAMRQRICTTAKGMTSSTQTESSAEMVIETLTLKQLSEKTDTKYLKSNFLCKVRVKNVKENDNWWYFCCNKNNCHEEVSKIEGKYKCFKCNRNYPIAQKRYKIVVLAEDETEAFNCVLFDRAAKRIIGKTATKLIAETIDFETTKSYPADIKQLKGKDIILKIELSDDNIMLKSSIYNATDAYDCGASLTSESVSVTASGSSSENVEV